MTTEEAERFTLQESQSTNYCHAATLNAAYIGISLRLLTQLKPFMHAIASNHLHSKSELGGLFMNFRTAFILSALLLPLMDGGESRAQGNPQPQPGAAPANPGQPNLPPWRASSQTLQASIVVGQGFAGKPPEGFTNVYSVATGGFGTFAVAVPKGWMQWTAGTPPVAIIEAFRRADPAWAKAHEPYFSGRDPRKRALLLNNNPAELLVSKVSFVAQATPKTLADWQANYRTIFTKGYWDSMSSAEWIDQSAGKTLKAISYSPDKAYFEISYHIPETKNSTLWILTCGGKTQIMQGNIGLCDKIASTFAGGPYME